MIRFLKSGVDLPSRIRAESLLHGDKQRVRRVFSLKCALLRVADKPLPYQIPDRARLDHRRTLLRENSLGGRNFDQARTRARSTGIAGEHHVSQATGGPPFWNKACVGWLFSGIAKSPHHPPSSPKSLLALVVTRSSPTTPFTIVSMFWVALCTTTTTITIAHHLVTY
ncbi:hypothetical protein F5Y19DRAFT_472109 [Xylariaceae sp. FL1651]|nr:hypothetical protein F5Y19DRAFT_472109 [Xylariaceae sp. FL1651]